MLSLCPSTANVSPSETVQGSIESQGPPLRPSAVVSLCLREEQQQCGSPRALPAFPETVLQHIVAGPEYLARRVGRKSPEASSFGE